MSAEFETLLKNYDRYLKDADLYEEFSGNDDGVFCSDS